MGVSDNSVILISISLITDEFEHLFTPVIQEGFLFCEMLLLILCSSRRGGFYLSGDLQASCLF